MERTRLNISFLWLFVVASLGCILRIYPVSDITLNYKNILHAHSHVAFLGWIFTSLFTLISISFLNSDSINKKIFNRLFALSQVAVTGMLFSFLYQGYGPISISFSTLHMAVSIWFAVSVFKACKTKTGETMPLSVKFLFAALSFMILSSLGPLSLPVITKLYGAGSPFYSDAIYFYLHFQYNGWFIFTLFAFLFRKLETTHAEYSHRNASLLFQSLLLSCVFSYFLSVLWSSPSRPVWLMAGFGAILQLAALVFFYILLAQIKWKPGGIIRLLGYCIVIAFTAKIVLQFLSAFPLFAEMASSFRSFVIAYIHLVVLGVVTISIFSYFLAQGLLDASKKTTITGLLLFISGFIVSELLAVAQGLTNYFSASITYYSYMQIGAAFIIFSGVGFIYAGRNILMRLKVQHLTINSINIINNSKLQS